MGYRTGFKCWRAASDGFAGWSLEDGREDVLLSPPEEPGFPVYECIPSWNADVPAGSWLEIGLRARIEGRWTRWYDLGSWSPGSCPVARRSVGGQKDEAGEVATDTLKLFFPASALQARARLCSPKASARPLLRAFSLAYSGLRPKTFEPSGEPGLRGRIIEGVPKRSQMVFPDGGISWCSPVSAAMVLGYWTIGAFPTKTDIRIAAADTYDEEYGGCGNWSFSVAYAGGPGMEAYVVRFSCLNELEPWIAAGVPVVISVSWNEAEGRRLTGAPLEKSSGHLTVLVGFDAEGNPVMNEPAAPSDAEVRRVFDRKELEARWLEASGGAAYLIYPEGHSVPAFPRGA